LSTRCRAAKFIFVSTDDDISVEEKLDTDKEDKQFSDPIRMEKTKELDQVREREREKGRSCKSGKLHFTSRNPDGDEQGGTDETSKRPSRNPRGDENGIHSRWGH
jgi:hypothetical protein